jgi:hypothetical protein
LIPTLCSARARASPLARALSIDVAQALDKHLGIPQQAPEAAAQAYGLHGGCARNLLTLGVLLVKDCRRRRYHVRRVLAVRLQLALEAGNLEAGIVALARNLLAIFGGGQELSVLIMQRVRQTLDRRENGRQIRRRRRRLARLACRRGLAPGLKNLHQAAFGDRGDRSVVARVAFELTSLDHSLDGSAAHPQRTGGLIEVNEIVFGCRRQHVHHLPQKSVAVATQESCPSGHIPAFAEAQSGLTTRDNIVVSGADPPVPQTLELVARWSESGSRRR